MSQDTCPPGNSSSVYVVVPVQSLKAVNKACKEHVPQNELKDIEWGMDSDRTDLLLLLLLLVDAGLMERAERDGASLVLRRILEGPEVGPSARGPARADLTISPLPTFLFFCNRASSFFNLRRSWTSATKHCVVEMDTMPADRLLWQSQ